MLTSCGSNERPASGNSEPDPQASFASYAQDLFRELQAMPLSDTHDVEIGMFGDLNLMAGENVVMGRYRYRVDSTVDGAAGHLNFFARSSDGGELVPVVLVFNEDVDTWVLREAMFVPADSRTTSLEEVLDRHLDDWVHRAASDVAASSR